LAGFDVTVVNSFLEGATLFVVAEKASMPCSAARATAASAKVDLPVILVIIHAY
jgi:Zn finger protein HypA/HybF involved in hydrogenase expression